MLGFSSMAPPVSASVRKDARLRGIRYVVPCQPSHIIICCGAHLHAHLAVPGEAHDEVRDDEAPGGRVQCIAGDIIALEILSQLPALKQHPCEAAQIPIS